MIWSITYKFLIANTFNVARIIFPAVLQLVLVVTYWLHLKTACVYGVQRCSCRHSCFNSPKTAACVTKYEITNTQKLVNDNVPITAKLSYFLSISSVTKKRHACITIVLQITKSNKINSWLVASNTLEQYVDRIVHSHLSSYIISTLHFYILISS